MGTVWAEGRYLKTGGSTIIINCGSGGVSEESLKNYVTKEELETLNKEIDSKLGKVDDHKVENRVLTIG